MERTFAFAALCVLLLQFSTVYSQFATNQLTTSGISERAQRALFINTAAPTNYNASFLLPINTVTTRTDNQAARQLQADKNAFPFLATLPNQGSANFITVLKPCGLILPHVHPRGTEQYVIISGLMTGGIAEENGGRQNIVFNITAGQSMVVPQGLVHYNTNPTCNTTIFIQAFNSADAGTINLINSLATLRAVDPVSAAASNLTMIANSTLNAFALDNTCLSRCGFNTTTGGGYGATSPDLRNFLGVPLTAP